MAAPLSRRKSISYSKWGYFFIAPFFIIYAIFSLIPLIDTFKNSFFEYYYSQLKWTGPNFVGFDNYKMVLSGDLMKYFGNTFIIWIIGFIPQIVVSLALASWFTDLRLKLKATGFFKVVIYLPNVIMAAAISMLFYSIFSEYAIGPINSILLNAGVITEPYKFFSYTTSTRLIIAGINFLMWYGNTTIMLMAAIMGVDTSLYESAQIDGANPTQTFWKITIPLIRPILLYVLVTSLIGGIQMFDIPSVITNAKGAPNRTTMTVVMYLNNYLTTGKNYGMAGAVSVILFIVAAVLSLLVFYLMRDKDAPKKKLKKKKGANLL